MSKTRPEADKAWEAADEYKKRAEKAECNLDEARNALREIKNTVEADAAIRARPTIAMADAVLRIARAALGEEKR